MSKVDLTVCEMFVFPLSHPEHREKLSDFFEHLNAKPLAVVDSALGTAREMESVNTAEFFWGLLTGIAVATSSGDPAFSDIVRSAYSERRAKERAGQ